MLEGKTAAIIPVRGGSRGIPRKNARLLAGKPLLAYSVEAALSARRVEAVYVSTDDAELAEIARRCGAEVLERKERLALDEVTLDEVILEAVRQIEDSGSAVGQVVTIQATCPLITAHTIDAVCDKQIEEELDSVLTVVDDTHLGWRRGDDGNMIPGYQERVNRQFLPRHYRETGGVIVCSRGTIESGSRIGKRVGVVEVSKTEAIDIDDYFDWWMAEKSLFRKCIYFHVIGNGSVGLGHVYRALTLADRLIDHDLCFVVNEQSGLAAQLIERRFYPVKVVPEGEEAHTIIEDEPHLVINDVLDTEESFMLTLKQAGLAVINFEDLGPGSLGADYLINAMYDSHPVRKDNKVLGGVEYCCLRDEFYSIQPGAIKKQVKNVLLLFGGTDPNGTTIKCLRWLDEIRGDWKITVILGIGHEHPDEVREYAAEAQHEIEIVCDTTIISRYMADADVAITSAGRTVFELGSLGVPTVVTAQNEREMHHVFAQSSPGVIFCGQANQLEKKKFVDMLEQIINSDLMREKMREALLGSGLREGIQNVLDTIEAVLRHCKRRVK
ncbi:cytidylyltransferase domain-containing protein [Planctomycetota bacterium]